MRPPLEDPRLAAIVWVACFGSIWTMLGHLWRIAPFWVLGIVLLVPSLLVVAGGYAVAVRRGHAELALAIRLGAWGGVWGTLGYDVVRIPLHLAGLNPFPPIRSYGMFLANAPHASLGTDLLGAAYHFSNGVTFGILYAVLMRRRSLWWGVLWGLVLETLAVVTPFGAIYALRTAPLVLFVAYFAHLYYGLPLGGALRDPEHVDALVRRPAVRGATALGVVAVVAFLTLAWTDRGAPEPGVVEVGPGVLRSGWTRLPVGTPLRVRNVGDAPITVRVTHGADATVPAGGEATVAFAHAGLWQLKAPETGARSVFVSVERDGYPAEPGTW